MRASPSCILFLGAVAAACGDQAGPADAVVVPDGVESDVGSPDDAAEPDDAEPGDVESPDDVAELADAGEPDDAGDPDDAAGPDDAGPEAPDGDEYVPGSLASCWTDAACPRVMAIAHGGAWNVASAPYNSDAALANAHELGCDGVKIDVRVTADDVPVIAHSSPIEYYESLDCGGRRIEEMTAAQVTACHRLPSLTERFQRLDDVLGWLRDKMVVQLCVKVSGDIQRTIREIHDQAAEDFAFIELDPSDLRSLVPTLEGADSVWYLVNIADNLAEVDTLLDVVRNPRAFLFEFDPGIDVSTLAPDRLHPAGVRSFTYDSATPLSIAAIRSYFENGYDVVSTQSAANAVEARRTVNSARGVSPP
ncbi:MAG: hypothetical protein HY907_03540 [Deltaproteobacteria bacterium]|nr:hypothetical protein [Deltaproteobacteria bacterium]